MSDVWKELEKFKLPKISENEQASASLIERKLVEVVNYMVYVSQYEPVLKSEIEKLELEINQCDRVLSNLILDGQLAEIPEEYKKNKEKVYAYITRKLYKKEIEDLEKGKQDKRSQLLKKREEYNRLDRMLKQARITIDTGRTILSALKEELKHSTM
jgi:hypothetical protein